MIGALVAVVGALAIAVLVLGALLVRARRQPPIDRPPVLADPPRIKYLTDAKGVMLRYDPSKPIAAAKRAAEREKALRRIEVRRSGITRRPVATPTPVVQLEDARRKRA